MLHAIDRLRPWWYPSSMSRVPPRMIVVAHRDTFRCPRCGLTRAVEVSREVAVDEAVGVTDDNRAAVAQLAEADLRLVRCPSCGGRARIGFHLAIVLGVSFPLLAVGATSWLMQRHVVAMVGLFVGGLCLVLGLRAPGSADRAVRFLEAPEDGA